MDTLTRLSQLRSQRDGLLKKLAAIGDFRPGSMGPRFRKCGKPGCHCAHDGEKGHGPIWSLTRKVEGKTVTKAIPVVAVDQTRQQLAEYQRFHKTVGELVEASVRICDTLLESRQESGMADGTPAGGEKGGSKKRSTRRS